MITTRERSPAPEPRLGPLQTFRAEVLRGLSAPRKTLPCKYFYDENGSRLFEQITRLEEYYPTRTERAIMERHAAAMASLLGRRCLLIEYGSGSSTKTRLLLDHATDLAAYLPVDVSEGYLTRAARSLAGEYPHIPVRPLCADFTRDLKIPASGTPAARRVVYFPGSTIGNFPPDEAVTLLRRTAALCGPGGALLLGADLQKDKSVLEAAYNDKQGITAAFNRNILVRINRELGADFAVEDYDHRAFYNAEEGRIEMHLVSRRDQRVHIARSELFLGKGECIHTENSYKYTLPDLSEYARLAGFNVARSWTDDARYFSVQYWPVA